MKKMFFLMSLISAMFLFGGTLDAKASHSETWNIKVGESVSVPADAGEPLAFKFNFTPEAEKIYRITFTDGIDNLSEKGLFVLEAMGDQCFDDVRAYPKSLFKEHYSKGLGFYTRFDTYKDSEYTFSVVTNESFSDAFNFTFVIEEEVIPAGSKFSDDDGRIFRSAGGNRVFLYSEPVRTVFTYGVDEQYEIDGATFYIVGICKHAFTKCKNMKRLFIYHAGDIEDEAFKNLKHVELIDLQMQVKSIGKNAFAGCKSLKKIKINGNSLTKINKKAFKGVKKKTEIHVWTRNKSLYNKLKKQIKKAGASKSKFKNEKYCED